MRDRDRRGFDGRPPDGNAGEWGADEGEGVGEPGDDGYKVMREDRRWPGDGEYRSGGAGWGYGPEEGWGPPEPPSWDEPAPVADPRIWPGSGPEHPWAFAYPRDGPPMATPYLPPPPGGVGYPALPGYYADPGMPSYDPVYDQRDDRDLVRRLSVLSLSLFYLIVFLNFIGLVFAIMRVPGRIMNLTELRLFYLSPLPPYLMVMGFDVGGTGMVLFFLFLVVSIFASLEVMLLGDGRSFLNLSRKLLDNQHLTESERREFDNNGFVLLGELFMALLFFNICMAIALDLLGREMRTPDFDELETWELMYVLARAVVWEEVVSRVLLIGAPIFTLYLVNGIDHSEERERSYDPGRPSGTGGGPGQEEGWNPGGGSGPGGRSGSRRTRWSIGLNHLLGGNLRITPFTGGLIIFSSLLFGLAHMEGWDAFKVIPTTMGGFILGYLFLKKGVHVCIMLHFAINYLSVLPEVLREDLALVVLFFIGLLIIVMFSMGGYMFYKYMKRLLSHTYRMIAGRPFRFANHGDIEFRGGNE